MHPYPEAQGPQKLRQSGWARPKIIPSGSKIGLANAIFQKRASKKLDGQLHTQLQRP